MARVHVRDDVAIWIVPKCACTSLNTISPKIGFDRTKTPLPDHFTRRVLLLRSPHERMASCYRSAYADKSLPFASRVEAVCAGVVPHDWHTLPQTDISRDFHAKMILRWDFDALAAIISAPLPRT